MEINRITHIPGGPPAAGPYSLGVMAEGKFLFVAGQGPYDPAVGKFVRGSLQEQTELTLRNLQRVVEAAGATMDDVVSCRVFLQQLTEQNFALMNEVYARFFVNNQAVRTTIGCQLLNIDVEIDAVVTIKA